MNKNLFFSITIPAYKALYLSEAIDSVLQQTYSNLELIIVNDASPENITDVVAKYRDKRIKYYLNEINCGAVNVVDNWNKCLEYASGDYIICMGDDDRLCTNCLEEYVRLIEKYPGRGAYQALTDIIDEEGEVFDHMAKLPETESVWKVIYENWKGRGQYIGNILFDVDRLRKEGGFTFLPMALSSDEISTYKSIKDTGIANSQIPIFQYRKSRYTITNNGSVIPLMEAIDMEYKWYLDFFDRNYVHESDKKYYNFLKKNIKKHITKKKKSVVFLNIKGKPITAIVAWFSCYAKYNLSFIDIVKVFIHRLCL